MPILQTYWIVGNYSIFAGQFGPIGGEKGILPVSAIEPNLKSKELEHWKVEGTSPKYRKPDDVALQLAVHLTLNRRRS